MVTARIVGAPTVFPTETLFARKPLRVNESVYDPSGRFGNEKFPFASVSTVVAVPASQTTPLPSDTVTVTP
jgi:hypothetical protein